MTGLKQFSSHLKIRILHRCIYHPFRFHFDPYLLLLDNLDFGSFVSLTPRVQDSHYQTSFGRKPWLVNVKWSTLQQMNHLLLDIQLVSILRRFHRFFIF